MNKKIKIVSAIAISGAIAVGSFLGLNKADDKVPENIVIGTTQSENLEKSESENMINENDYLNGNLEYDGYSINFITPPNSKVSTTIIGALVNTGTEDISNYTLRCELKLNGELVASDKKYCEEIVKVGEQSASPYFFFPNIRNEEVNEIVLIKE